MVQVNWSQNSGSRFAGKNTRTQKLDPSGIPSHSTFNTMLLPPPGKTRAAVRPALQYLKVTRLSQRLQIRRPNTVSSVPGSHFFGVPRSHVFLSARGAMRRIWDTHPPPPCLFGRVTRACRYEGGGLDHNFTAELSTHAPYNISASAQNATARTTESTPTESIPFVGFHNSGNSEKNINKDVAKSPTPFLGVPRKGCRAA